MPGSILVKIALIRIMQLRLSIIDSSLLIKSIFPSCELPGVGNVCQNQMLAIFFLCTQGLCNRHSQYCNICIHCPDRYLHMIMKWYMVYIQQSCGYQPLYGCMVRVNHDHTAEPCRNRFTFIDHKQFPFLVECL